MAELQQQTRFLNIATPLGENALVLTSFTGHEEMSRLFTYHLEMVSEREAIAAAEIVGKNVTVSLDRADGRRTCFNGFVSRFVADYGQGNLPVYRAEMVPWLWFLTQTADCRIFQEKTIPQIIEQIFKDLGFSDYKLDLKGQHEKWEYCVQYRETDFNFVSRLMEQEGIFYYFRHRDGKHILMLADHVGAYDDLPEKEVRSPPSHAATQSFEDHITNWEHQYEFCSGKWAQTDYNFETPSTSLMTNENSVVNVGGNGKYEVYDYPGEYPDKGRGKAYTKLRMEEEEVPHDEVRGASTCRTFAPGGKFTLVEHVSSAEEGKSYVIAAIQHYASEPAAYSSGDLPGSVEYANTFTCIPEKTVFRPPRTTPKPLVTGIQTAVVVGPKGEEIYCDKYGRVKVQFHWDREGKRDEKSSLWIRTAHNIAGKKWGFLAIPRIGQEVVVEFLEGDPDRPLIVGSVYNAEQMPHYDLPAEKTKSYIKTNTSKGGDGHNEIMFEDKANDERLYLHAQKNMDVRVRNDSKTRIYGNRHQIIGYEKDGKKGGDQREMVYQDKHLKIKRHQIEHIEGNFQLTVGKGDADGGNVDILIEKQKTETIEGGSDLHVKGDVKEKTDGGQSLTVGGDLHQKSGGNVAVECGPMNEIHLKAGMKVIIEAGMQISLKGPGGFINIGPSGVDIQGILVNINSGGSAGSGSGCSPQAPQDAKKAEPTEPDQAHTSKSGMKSAPD